MYRFLNYSYSLLLCLFVFACNKVQQEEKPAEIPFTQDDLTQIYSLAFDSLLGSPTNWLPENKEIGNDTLIVHLNYNLEHIGEEFGSGIFSINEKLLSEKRYYGNGDKMLEKFDGFEKEVFNSILADSIWSLYSYKVSGAIVSNFNYKPILEVRTKEAYFPSDTLGKVTLYKIAFNKDADFAIVTTGLYIGPEHGTGYAYFFRKENGKWRVVGKNRLYIS